MQELSWSFVIARVCAQTRQLETGHSLLPLHLWLRAWPRVTLSSAPSPTTCRSFLEWEVRREPRTTRLSSSALPITVC